MHEPYDVRNMIDPNNPETRCYDVLGDVAEAVRDVIPEGIPYYVLGGVATGALESTSTQVDVESHKIHAAEGSDKSIFREEGSRRDIDILVLDMLPKDTFRKLDERVAKAIGGSLIVSSFGIKEHKEGYSKKDRALEAVKRVVSARTRDSSGQDYYEMFPLVQPVQRSSYMPWTLVTPQGFEVDVLHPVGHELAYTMRSIGGPRPKDIKKMKNVHNVNTSNPDFIGITDAGSEFNEWAMFAQYIQALRAGTLPVNHRSIHPSSSLADQRAFQIKAKALHFLESQEKVVNFALHGPMQKVLNIFVGAGK